MNTKTNHGTPIELLEGNERTAPVGSGAPSGFAAAERSANQTRCGGEERSDELESLAVSPGEAKAALLWAVKFSTGRAADFRQEVDWANEDQRLQDAKYHKKAAVMWAKRACFFQGMLPEPDSEAPEERSGRRNARAMPPATEQDHGK